MREIGRRGKSTPKGKRLGYCMNKGRDHVKRSWPRGGKSVQVDVNKWRTRPIFQFEIISINLLPFHCNVIVIIVIVNIIIIIV